MSAVWIFMLVALSLQQVFARDCSRLENINNCDECIRCGAIWCYAPNMRDSRCSFGSDDWCPSHKQQLLSIPETSILSTEGLNPSRHDRSVQVGGTDAATFVFKGAQVREDSITIKFVNSTLTDQDLILENFEIYKEVTFNQYTKENQIKISGRPSTDFCPQLSTDREFITWRVSLENDGKMYEAMIKYHVPCSCSCKKIEHSPTCNERGSLSCGACECDKGWTGSDCKKMITNKPDCDRGDISGCENIHTGELCSNNGQCQCDGTCICNQDQKYLDEQCTDICTQAGYCDDCLRNQALGKCDICQMTLYLEPFNKTLVDRIDDKGRPIWIECEENLGSCSIQYVIMKDEYENAHVMIVDSCRSVVAGIVSGKVDVTVPVILGVLALVAATAAVAGYMVWKNRTPPVPLNDSQYQNIDAEDCTGENPLYKPPTSFFKNPTYQKW